MKQFKTKKKSKSLINIKQDKKKIDNKKIKKEKSGKKKKKSMKKNTKEKDNSLEKEITKEIKNKNEDILNMEYDITQLNIAIDNNEFLFKFNFNEDNDNMQYTNKNLVFHKDITNLKLDYINKYKNIIKMTKCLKNKPLNYDYITNKELNEININKLTDEEIKAGEESEKDSEDNDKENTEINQNNSKETEDYNKTDNIDEDNIQQLIDVEFINYEKKYNTNKTCWWPINVRYGGKKYALMTKKNI